VLCLYNVHIIDLKLQTFSLPGRLSIPSVDLNQLLTRALLREARPGPLTTTSRNLFRTLVDALTIRLWEWCPLWCIRICLIVHTPIDERTTIWKEEDIVIALGYN
jgi:hypothetical protein